MDVTTLSLAKKYAETLEVTNINNITINASNHVIFDTTNGLIDAGEIPLAWANIIGNPEDSTALKAYLDGLLNEHGIPSGGGTGQVLSKKTDSDFDTEWAQNGTFVDAPTDNKTYGRKNAAWEEVTTDGVTLVDTDGAETLIEVDNTNAQEPIVSSTTALKSAVTAANSAYQKPATGIPKGDLTAALQGSVDLADTALQPTDVINDLTTGGTDVPLSAEQGKILNAKVPRAFAKVYYVDPTNSADTAQNGTESHPYSSVSTLLTAHGTEKDVLAYLRNTDNVDLLIENLEDWTFSGFLATKDGGRTNVKSISILGASTGIYLIGLVVNTFYEDNSTVGNNYMRYCTVKGNTTINSDGYSCFELSSAMGDINAIKGSFDFLNSQMELAASLNLSGGTTTSRTVVTNGRRVSIVQNGGTLIAIGATTFIPPSGGSQYSIQVSTGNCVIMSGDSTVYPSGLPAPISITGDAIYSLGTLAYNAQSSNISTSGIEVLNGLQARQILDAQTFTNITPSSTRQRDINTALDTLLGTIKQTADNALTVASTAKHFKGQVMYGADSNTTRDTITTMINNDKCWVDSNNKFYTYDAGTTSWVLDNPQPTAALGDQYDIAKYYGTFVGATYTGNATATITCDEDTAGSENYALIVSESTPVDQNTIKTVNGTNQVADRTVTTATDAAQFTNGNLKFTDFFAGVINKINTLITNIGSKQDKLIAGTSGGIVTHSGTQGVEGSELDPTTLATKSSDFVTALTATNKGLTVADRALPVLTFATTDYFTAIKAKLVPLGLNTNNESVQFTAVGTNLGLPSGDYKFEARQGTAAIINLIATNVLSGLTYITGDYSSTTERPFWKQINNNNLVTLFTTTTAGYYIHVGCISNPAGLRNITGRITSVSEYVNNAYNFSFRFRANTPTLPVTNNITMWGYGNMSGPLYMICDRDTGNCYIGPFINYDRPVVEIYFANDNFTPLRVDASTVDAFTNKQTYLLPQSNRVPTITFTATDFFAEVKEKLEHLGLLSNSAVEFGTPANAAGGMTPGGVGGIHDAYLSADGSTLYLNFTNNNGARYNSTYSSTTTKPVWTLSVLNLTTLKSIVESSADFAAFKTAIANL